MWLTPVWLFWKTEWLYQTIKGNDVFPRFPQGRMISAPEFAPQNNPQRDRGEKPSHYNKQQQQPSALFQQPPLILLISLATSCLYIISRSARSCLQLQISLWSHLRTIISLFLSHYPLSSPRLTLILTHTAATLDPCFFLLLVQNPPRCESTLTQLHRQAPSCALFLFQLHRGICHSVSARNKSTLSFSSTVIDLFKLSDTKTLIRLFLMWDRSRAETLWICS